MLSFDAAFLLVSGTFMCTLIVLRLLHWRRQNPVSPRLVGPAYWGVYEGVPVVDDPAKVRIKCNKPSPGSVYTVGSGRYASGGAVKSARS